MDVEQRHDAERDIAWRQPVGGGDVVDRREEVAVPKRDELRAAGGPARVQDERHVIVVRGACGPRSVARGVALQRELAIAVHVRLDEAHAGGHRAAGGFALAWRDDQDARAGVLQVEAELLLFICGVQRGRCPDRRGGEKQDYRLDAVGKDQRHPVVPAHAELRQVVGCGGDLLAQLGIGQADPARHDYCGVGCRAVLQDVEQSAAGHHLNRRHRLGFRASAPVRVVS